MKIYLNPKFEGVDKGDGGVRRVIEALHRHLPSYDVEIVEEIERADLVHIHIKIDESLARYLRINPDKLLVVQSHGLYWLEYAWPEWALKTNAQCMEAIRWADHVIAPSNWVAQTIRRNSLRPTTALPHGIELDDWQLGVVKKDYVLWNKTRHDPVCDPEALNNLARALPDIQFMSTYGQKDLPNLTLTGRLPYIQAQQLVREAAVYLCTARETFGIGTLEAMAAGCAVVGWNWGGQREIIEHKKTGWLSTPGDYNHLAEGIEYCFSHREELGAAAREVVVKNYQWQSVIGEYVKLYEQLLAQQPLENTPRVSIVVPAYALEEWLPICLDSVLQQTYKDWECIVVDDASPDRCGAIADNFASQDSRIRVIHNESNQYLAGALNTGISAAKGSYVLPLDADNLLPRQAVGLLANALDNDRSIHIAYGGVEFLNPDGKTWHSGWPPKFRAEWQVQRRENEERPANLVPSGSMYRRKVWELTGGYRRRWKTAEDADFWTRATSYGFRAAMVTEADVLTYRNREESMSRQHQLRDWTTWYPWSRELAAAPAAITYEKQVPVPSYEPLLVSVIIPVGPGHEQLVVDAVDSVDAQTLRLWECIVVNDSGKPLPPLPNWVKVVSTRKGPKGVSRARNLGLRHAKAALFVPLDADDTLEPEALSKMFEVWQTHKGYVYSDWHELWDEGPIKVWNAPDYDAQLLTKKGCIHAITALYPVEAWKKVGGFDEELPAWEDWDFQFQLAKLGICGTRIPQALFTYRKDTGMRREENYAAFEISKKGILDKWGGYFTGEEELMGCRSCPGGGGKKIAMAAPNGAQMAAARPANVDATDLVLIEYFGAKAGALNYLGPSGQIYRFSSEERQKYIRREDLEHFLSMRDFRAVQKEAPVA